MIFYFNFEVYFSNDFVITFKLCDFLEDNHPLKEIDFSGVIHKLINWRPPCLFGSRPPASDSEESETEEEKWEKIDRAIDMMQPQNIGKIG